MFTQTRPGRYLRWFGPVLVVWQLASDRGWSERGQRLFVHLAILTPIKFQATAVRLVAGRLALYIGWAWEGR